MSEAFDELFQLAAAAGEVEHQEDTDLRARHPEVFEAEGTTTRTTEDILGPEEIRGNISQRHHNDADTRYRHTTAEERRRRTER